MFYFFHCLTSQVWRLDAYEGFTQEDLPESCCVKSEGKPVQKCHYKGFFTVRQPMRTKKSFHVIMCPFTGREGGGAVELQRRLQQERQDLPRLQRGDLQDGLPGCPGPSVLHTGRWCCTCSTMMATRSVNKISW